MTERGRRHGRRDARRFCVEPTDGSTSLEAIGCVALLLAIFSPRLALICVWLFSGLLGRAFEGAIVPLLGFFLLPWTTLVYVLVWSSSHRVDGFEWLLVAAAFLVDIGAFARAREQGRSRRH